MFLGAGGLGLIWTGAAGIVKVRRQVRTERARAAGVVVGLVRHAPRRRGGAASWHPVVEFRAGARTCRFEDGTGYRKDEFAVGERVDVLFDPDDPVRFHLDKLFDVGCAGDRTMIAVGAVWFVLAALIAFFVSRSGIGA